MKILIAGRGHNVPGKYDVGIFEMDQARALREAGHEVRFAALDTRSIRHPRALGFRESVIHEIPIAYGIVPCGPLPAPLPEKAEAAAARGAWRLITRDGWRPDIIHQHFKSGFGEIAAGEKIPYIYTEHASWRNRPDLPEREAQGQRKDYSYASRVLCVSGSLRENIRKNTGVAAQVVPNIVDTESFSPSLRKAHGGGFHFVSAGNLIGRKGYDLLLAAMGKAVGEGLDLRLTIVGGGPEEETLKKQAETMGLKDRVSFRGRRTRPEMAAMYREADAFVLASRRETFGVVYIEAMAAGLPVIATPCGGPEDFVTPETGLLVPTEDVNALKTALERMAREREKYDSAAVAAYARAHFAPEVIAARLTQVYEEVLKC